MKLRTLGELSLEDHPLQRPKPLLLLAYLSLEGAKPRRFLSELFFWNAQDPADALSTTLGRLRRAGAIAESSGPVRSLVQSDAAHLLRLLDAGAIDQALSMYGAPFLAQVPVRLGNELEEWVYATRESIAGRVRRALLKRAEASVVSGDSEAAARDAEAAFVVPGAPDPGPVDLLRLARLLAHRNSAVATAVRELATQYGIDSGTPEVPAVFPSPEPAPSAYFPTPLTSLVGRDEELVEIPRLLQVGACRLLTLHGPAGVGKSRLARQVAADQYATGGFPDGVIFVLTETLASLPQVIGVAAGQLGASVDRHADPYAALAHLIGGRRLLLVLDGFEHLVAVKGAQTAVRLRQLLLGCPGLSLLITSRQRLNLAEEWVMPIAGLRVPDDDLAYEDALLADALQLFVRRAQLNDVSFRLEPAELPLARRICRAVQGFPLGIELAAAWTTLLPLSDLADSLETNLRTLAHREVDVGSRHPSLWAALEHSWNLLEDEDREVLAKLAVFRGGFRSEATAFVAQASMTTLARLADRALVRGAQGGRFELHALLGQFALEKLLASGQFGSTAARHAEYYSGLLASSGRGGEANLHATFHLLMEDEANLLASLDWAAENQRADVLLDLAETLGWYFPMSGRFLEGDRCLEGAQERFTATTAQGREALASLLLGRAWLNRYAGSLENAGRLSAAGEEHARAAGSEPQLVRALDLRGQVLTYEGRFDDARALLQEGVDLARAHGDPLRLTRVLCNLALLEALRGATRAADDLLDEATQPFERLHVPPNLDMVAVLLARGVTAICRFDHAAAVTALTNGVALARELEYLGPVPLLNGLLAAALLTAAQADGRDATDEVQRLITAGTELAESSQEGMATSILHCAAAALALHAGDADLAVEEARNAYAVSRRAGNTVIMLWSLPYLARALSAKGDVAGGLQLTQHLLTHPGCPQWIREVARELAARWSAIDPNTVPPALSTIDDIVGVS